MQVFLLRLMEQFIFDAVAQSFLKLFFYRKNNNYNIVLDTYLEHCLNDYLQTQVQRERNISPNSRVDDAGMKAIARDI